MRRRGTWLRPYVVRDGFQAHYLPEHTLNTPVYPGELTRCGQPVERMGAGAAYQDWRCPWGASNTCQGCVAGLQADEDAE